MMSDPQKSLRKCIQSGRVFPLGQSARIGLRKSLNRGLTLWYEQPRDRREARNTDVDFTEELTPDSAHRRPGLRVLAARKLPERARARCASAAGRGCRPSGAGWP